MKKELLKEVRKLMSQYDFEDAGKLLTDAMSKKQSIAYVKFAEERLKASRPPFEIIDYEMDRYPDTYISYVINCIHLCAWKKHAPKNATDEELLAASEKATTTAWIAILENGIALLKKNGYEKTKEDNQNELLGMNDSWMYF